MRILVYGVPGVGKTYASKILGKKLNLPVIEGDKIKDKIRKGKSKSDFPFLFLVTCLAYKQFGELNEENVIKGLLAVRQALNEAVLEEIKDKDDFILEAAFLDPNQLKDLGKVILITQTDEKVHKSQFLKHREKLLDFKNNEFKAARIVQEYLIKEAEKLRILVDPVSDLVSYFV